MSNTMFLCGFMGSGKSEIVKKINNKSIFSTSDLDMLIEKKHGKIETIFKEYGESFFRSIEKDVFFENYKKFNLLALGGGSIDDNEIYDYILNSKKGIYLEESFDILWSRISDSSRPLVQNGKKYVKDRFENRRHRFEKLHFRISSSNIDSNVRRVINLLNNDN